MVTALALPGREVATAPAPAVSPEDASLAVVRTAVRDLLLATGAFEALDPERKRELAQAMVRVCQTAILLLREEIASDGLARNAQSTSAPPGTPQSTSPGALDGAAQGLAAGDPQPASTREGARREAAARRGPAAPLAMAQTAGQQFSGVATQRLAGTTRDILNAVSFPRFVTDLINGVFKALVDSNHQQMQAYVELVKNVAASTDGFADANMAPDRARQWLIDQFPGSFEMEGGPDDSEDDHDPTFRDDEPTESRLKLKDGGAMPSEAALRAGLGLGPEESIPSGDPETTLVPFARRALARQRQQMLATMVMLGMQRIVIESGRLNASMRFHIDTRSAAASDAGSRFDFSNRFEASGKFGFGPWGVEAKMTNTIGYVSTQRDQTTEEMNTDLDLNSSVELYFKTDYLPLELLAGKGQVDRIKVNTLNPDADAAAARQERTARGNAERADEAQRRSSLDLTPRPESAVRQSDAGASRPTNRSQAGSTQQDRQASKASRTTPNTTRETTPSAARATSIA
jgi:hypothetical protein